MIEYQYNAVGDVTAIIPKDGQPTSQHYDYDAGYINSFSTGRLKDIQVGATDKYIYDYLDANPLIQKLTRPNGSYTDYQYNDPLKRLTDVINKTSTGALINQFSYTFNDRDLKDTETVTDGESITNFTAESTTYTPNNLNQTTGSSNPNQTFLYDDDGNMTQGYTPDGYAMTMTYDAENRLKSSEYTDSGSILHRTEYAYNGNSFVAEMRKFDNGTLTGTTRYVRAGFLPIQERDGSNAITREYTWGLNMGGGIGGLLNLRQNSSDYAFLYDGKGNVATLLNGTQAVVASYAYDPFGVVMKKTATIDQPFMFSTKEFDSQTGLSYYGYRFYNPSIGKWTTRDPLEEAGGWNLYGFVGNDPVNWIDPYGLDPLLPPPPPKGPPGSGCGDAKTDCIVPDFYPEACKAHDKCYSTPGKTQAQCDNEFWWNMFNESGPWPNVFGPTFFWAGVRLFGGTAYQRAQQQKK